ncbi:cobyric acid synthase [Alicyclobacillus dauci]|uniref:Cobyric acid synthase n=1 Tax=Alicyclobacillus dauci TaxID=1475485 RepID=A0ABY6Z4W4_9BACL|nr:cobyric acid synthase [Alicyclobacillus dauci]WAH37241.1 cobyric acid synthase [Alicyclobacillus dauci]
MAKGIMVVGTASHVGKSVIATALCRILKQDGYDVVPFKAQNMSLNSAVTPSGREIGRSQAAQAQACGVAPNEHMNPILLKPTSPSESQVIVQGRVVGREWAFSESTNRLDFLWSRVVESYQYLTQRHDVMVIEGAGSPVELNLKSRDLANMRTAELADADVLLVADIDRGGVFASVYGTLQLLTQSERERVKGIIINRFRGDPALFEDGVRQMESLTGVPVVGVIPYIEHVGVDEEDGVALESASETQRRHFATTKAIEDGQDMPKLRIAIIQLPYISNFTDIDPLLLEPDIEVHFCSRSAELEGAAAVIVPGSKNTMADLAWLHDRGFTEALHQLVQHGAFVVGICGGYQMLGRKVHDPLQVESRLGRCQGIGLFDDETTFQADKRTVLVQGTLCGPYEDIRVHGYEIHMGVTTRNRSKPFAQIRDGDSDIWVDEGSCSEDGAIIGTYMHGIFHNDAFRLAWLNSLRLKSGLSERAEIIAVDELREAAYDRLADTVRANLDMNRIYQLLRG